MLTLLIATTSMTTVFGAGAAAEGWEHGMIKTVPDGSSERSGGSEGAIRSLFLLLRHDDVPPSPPSFLIGRTPLKPGASPVPYPFPVCVDLSVPRFPDSLGITAAMLLLGGVVQVRPAEAYVALMAGQTARPLKGQFNNVPVLHSNQPEEVEGPGILINTAAGFAVAAETGQQLRNAEYTFNGEFGLHLHHKYFPPNRSSISPSARRPELTLAAILINPGVRPVHIRFEKGAVRNSFEAPYLANNLMGVKPLGPRPWNTGPGDATAVQMLRRRLDPRLSNEITIPARGRIVLFTTQLPALGLANALLRGRSDGPFQVAVVAGKTGDSPADLLAILDAGQLAPGRVYLNRIQEIQNRTIFSRVGGVALGDSYSATMQHDLSVQGPLHVPFTSTNRHHFGTREVQVNPLAIRMVDSSLDNVGTYGVRFDVDLLLRGNGPHELVMSHPSPSGGRHFTAFRGSIEIETPQGRNDVHVGLRSGQSLSLASLNLQPGMVKPVRVSMVYPADATPGHLLSVVPASQLARVQERERQLEIARTAPAQPPRAVAPPPALTAVPKPAPVNQPLPFSEAAPMPRPAPVPAAPAPPAVVPRPSDGILRPPANLMGTPARNPARPPWLVAPPPPPATGNDYVDRYRRAIEEQRRRMQGWP